MNESEMAVPHLFRCPISLDLFKDPVTLCTGQTYDRSSIEEWLAAGNLTCPVTMQRLHDPSIIVPNYTLRHLIDQWLELGGSWLDPVCKFPDPDPSLDSLKDDLESEGSSPVVKVRAIQKVHDLCLEFPSKARELVRLGLVPLLLRMVFGRTESDLLGERVSLLEQALGYALSLLDHGVIDDANVLDEASMVRSLSFFLDHGSRDVVALKVRICRLVEKISKPSNSGLCTTLGKNRGFLHSMISLLQQNSKVSESAVRAMQSLCCIQSNRENLIKEGALGGLIPYIASAKKFEQSRLILPPALTTIERLLLEVKEAKWVILSYPDGVRILVEMVFRVSGHETSESAVGSLMILCGDLSEAREEAIRAGVVTQLLLLIQSQCSGRIKTKARALLKMLRS